MMPAKIVLDPPSLAKLEQAPDGAQLCDAAGRIFGIMVSPDSYKRMRDVWQQFAYDEELGRRAEEDYRAGRCKTTAEVFEHLKSL